MVSSIFTEIAKLLGFFKYRMSWKCAFWSGHVGAAAQCPCRVRLQGAAAVCHWRVLLSVLPVEWCVRFEAGLLVPHGVA